MPITRVAPAGITIAKSAMAFPSICPGVGIVTVTLDTHGGELGKKFGFVRPVDERGRVVVGGGEVKFVGNDLDTRGDVVNPVNEFNPSFGGMDGGTGGCKCEYRNFVGVNGAVREVV